MGTRPGQNLGTMLVIDDGIGPNLLLRAQTSTYLMAIEGCYRPVTHESEFLKIKDL